MESFDQWFARQGPALARMFAGRRVPICDEVSERLAHVFPTLCDDPARPDRLAFQHLVVTKTPQRFHALLQVALQTHSLRVIEREYRWLWGVVPRYGVTSTHLLAMAGWYFNAARARIVLPPYDMAYLNELKRKVLRTIREIAPLDRDVRRESAIS